MYSCYYAFTQHADITLCCQFLIRSSSGAVQRLLFVHPAFALLGLGLLELDPGRVDVRV